MKFKSRQDVFFQVIFYGACLLVLLTLYQELTINKIDVNSYIATTVLLSVLIFILWILHGTNYELTQEHLKYRAAFLKGSIPIESINELIVGKTMWVGFKPATARKGIIVKYGKMDTIYISPESNEAFVKKIKELNPEIKITL